MSARRRWLRACAAIIIAVQAAIDIPLWLLSGRPLADLALVSGVSLAVLIVFAVSVRKALRKRSVYFAVLWTALLCAIIQIVGISISPFGRQENRPESTGLIVSLALVVTVVAIAFAMRYSLLSYIASYLLDQLSTRFFQRQLARDFGLVGLEMSEADILNAVSSSYPEGEQTGPGSDSTAGYVARGTAWAEGLLAENRRSGRPPQAPRPAVTSVGFARLRNEGVQLAVINYFRPAELFRAWRTMPRTISFAGRSFPVVARPWMPVEHTGAMPISGPLQEGGEAGFDGRCWVTFGEGRRHYGIVTALHVVGKSNLRPGTEASISTPTGEITGTLQQASKSMEAALIELTGVPNLELCPARHTVKAEIAKPVRLCVDRPLNTGKITEIGEFTKDGLYLDDIERGPVEPAIMFFDIIGKEGDSGSLVLDIDGRAPYVMYQGVMPCGQRKEGWGILLDQIHVHWGVDFQFNAEPGIMTLSGRAPGR